MKIRCKGIKESQSNEFIVENSIDNSLVCAAMWRMQMGRKMNELLTASQMKTDTRVFSKQYFGKLKELVKVRARSVYIEKNVPEDGLSSVESIFNLLEYRGKVVYFILQASVAENGEDINEEDEYAPQKEQLMNIEGHKKLKSYADGKPSKRLLKF